MQWRSAGSGMNDSWPPRMPTSRRRSPAQVRSDASIRPVAGLDLRARCFGWMSQPADKTREHFAVLIPVPTTRLRSDLLILPLDFVTTEAGGPAGLRGR